MEVSEGGWRSFVDGRLSPDWGNAPEAKPERRPLARRHREKQLELVNVTEDQRYAAKVVLPHYRCIVSIRVHPLQLKKKRGESRIKGLLINLLMN